MALGLNNLIDPIMKKTSLASRVVQIIAACLLPLLPGQLGGQTAHLVLQSQTGDGIGDGLNYDLTYTPDSSLFFYAAVRSLVSGEPAELMFTFGLPLPIATLFFGTDQL